MSPRTPTRRLPARGGFSLVELLVAITLALVLGGAIAAVTGSLHETAHAQPEVADLQQRLRVAEDAFLRDLAQAGAGMSRGRAAGPLARHLAPIRPFRIGLRQPDPPGAYDPSVISLIFAPPGAAEAAIQDPILSVPVTIRLQPADGCPLGDPLCGFRTGMGALVLDRGGAHDLFTIVAAEAGLVTLDLLGPALSRAYAAGSPVLQAETAVFHARRDALGDALTLMRYDGNLSDVPVTDQVVGLRFDYLGEPAAPRVLGLPGDAGLPQTTYGPAPPPIDVDDPNDLWPPGENCVFQVSGDEHVPRLADLAPGSRALVGLAPDDLRDGPWCPDAGAASRYDADLFRIRRVVVTMRLQVPQGAMRGLPGVLFARAGLSRGGPRFLPDQEIHLDVAPRNLELAR